MTSLAQLVRTPSTRDHDIEHVAEDAVRQPTYTPVWIRPGQHGLPQSWLSEWMTATGCLQVGEALIEHSQHGWSRSPHQVWAPLDATFGHTPALHASKLLEPLELAVTSSPGGVQPATYELPGSNHAERNPAAAAVGDLQRWLDLTVEQVAGLVGASKSALHYWKRENAQPRPGVARNLHRVHALVRALRAATAPDSPLIALTRRPDAGGPSAYDLLLKSRYEEAEELLRPTIFQRHEQAVQRPRLVSWEDECTAPQVSASPLRPPVRQARRVTLPK